MAAQVTQHVRDLLPIICFARKGAVTEKKWIN